MPSVLAMFTWKPGVGLQVKLDDHHIPLVENWGDVFNEFGGVIVPGSCINEAVHNGLDDGPTVIVRVPASINRERDVDSYKGRTQVAVQPESVAIACPRQRGSSFPDGDGGGPLMVMETSVTVCTPRFVGWLELDLDHLFDYTRTRRGGKMEAVLFVAGLVLVILGTAAILTAWDLFWWAVGKVTGIKIGDNGRDD